MHGQRVLVQVLRWGTQIAASAPVQQLASKLTSGHQPEQELPEMVDSDS